MQIVIDIPEEIYEIAKQGKWKWPADDVYNAIKNGKPLPKGHGDLIDRNKLDMRLNFVLNHTGGYKNTPIGTGIVIAMAENLDAKPIIKSDKECEAKVESEGKL